MALSLSATVGTYEYVHIPGKINPADILSKHWGYLMFGVCWGQFSFLVR